MVGGSSNQKRIDFHFFEENEEAYPVALDNNFLPVHLKKLIIVVLCVEKNKTDYQLFLSERILQQFCLEKQTTPATWCSLLYVPMSLLRTLCVICIPLQKPIIGHKLSKQ